MADISSARPVSAPPQAARQVAAPNEVALKLLQPLNGLLAAGESARAEVISIREHAQQFQLMLRVTLDNGRQSTLQASTTKAVEPGSNFLISALSDSRLLANLQIGNSNRAPMTSLDLEQLPTGSLVQGRVDSSIAIANAKGGQAMYQVVVTLLNSSMSGSRIQLETPMNLPVGSMLSAQVQGPQHLSFLPLAARLDQLEVKHHLGSQLTRQGSLEGLFAALQGLRGAAGLPSGVQGAIDRLFSNLPDAAQLSNPKGLAQALANSGEFLEGKLLGGTGVGQDLKANLLRLIGQLLPHLPGSLPTATAASQSQALGQALPGLLREALGQQLRNPSTFPLPNRLAKEMAAEGDLEGLLKLAAAAISRLQSHQLSSLGQTQINPDGNLTTTWQMEVPMRDQQQVVPLQIKVQSEEQSAKKKDAGQIVWRIDLAFDLSPLGPLQVQAQLVSGSISSHFWAERANTASLISIELEHLRTRLQNLGLQVGELDCQQGVPARGAKTSIEQRWVDEKA